MFTEFKWKLTNFSLPSLPTSCTVNEAKAVKNRSKYESINNCDKTTRAWVIEEELNIRIGI